MWWALAWDAGVPFFLGIGLILRMSFNGKAVKADFERKKRPLVSLQFLGMILMAFGTIRGLRDILLISSPTRTAQFNPSPSDRLREPLLPTKGIVEQPSVRATTHHDKEVKKVAEKPRIPGGKYLDDDE